MEEPSNPETRKESQLLCVGEVHILIVDDDRAICELMRAALEHKGFRIDTCSAAPRVLDQLKLRPYHLILLDYVIPGLQFDQVCQWLHEHQSSAGVIVVTGHPSIDSALSCLRAHTFDYLIKPVQVTDLRQVVMRCLESKGLMRMTEEALRESLGTAIRERRKMLALTLADMAKRTDLSVGYLSQIELGKNSASIETLYRISLGLGIKMADLFQAVRMQ